MGGQQGTLMCGNIDRVKVEHIAAPNIRLLSEKGSLVDNPGVCVLCS